MADKPSHKAMLFFLEVLMNSNGPLTISQLAGRFGSRNFNGEMRQACGSNESGLKAFLLKYPSLFTLRGNMVSLCTSGSSSADTHRSSSSSDLTEMSRPLPDISAEMDAVRYFQQRMASRTDKWVSVRSVAGHLSQAPMHIRATVGPQLDFRNWLIRHPHIFDVRDEMVSLCDGVAALTNGRRNNHTPLVNGNATLTPPAGKVPPKTPPAQRKTALRRSKSFSEKRAQEAELSDDEGPSFPEAAMLARKRRAPTTMTAAEYKAIMAIRETIESQLGMPLASVISQFLAAGTSSWTGPQLEAFLRANTNVFTITHDNMVTVRKGTKLNVVITGSRPTPATASAASSGRVLTGHKGRIFHVAKLWGIVDLGRHEHVFFDRSIMVRPLDDLKKVYAVGEMLHFNAVLAPKSSRAKWKAIRVWKETEQQPSANADTQGSIQEGGELLSPSASVEEEMDRFFGTTIPAPTDDKFGDAAPSGAGAVPVWNFAPNVATNGKPTMVPESYYMSASSLNDLHGAPEAQQNGNGAMTQKTYADCSSQTISTGDIIATQLFQDK